MLEQLFPIILISLVLFLRPLLRFLADWMKSHQHQGLPDVEPEVPPGLRRERTQRPRAERPPVLRAGSRGTPVPAMRPLVATRRQARSCLGSRRDVRRGIVLMTILGPCRTLEPPIPPR